MDIITTDGERIVDVGNSKDWNSLYSTVSVLLQSEAHTIPLALSFFKEPKCRSKNAEQTARQINLVRDGLSKYPPKAVVYNYKNLSEKAPWGDNISPVITSCANYFTTADGDDLLCELVKILVYASIKKVDVELAG